MDSAFEVDGELQYFMDSPNIFSSSPALSQDTNPTITISATRASPTNVDNDDVPSNLPSLALSPMRRSHRRQRSEVENPPTRETINPANLREVINNVVDEFELTEEDRALLYRIRQMSPLEREIYNLAVGLNVRRLHTSRPPTHDKDTIKKSPWFTKMTNFAADVLMSPMLLAYQGAMSLRICEVILKNPDIFGTPPNTVSNLRKELRSLLLGSIRAWRVKVHKKIELGVANKTHPWALAKLIVHDGHTLTRSHILRISLLRQIFIKHQNNSAFADDIEQVDGEQVDEGCLTSTDGAEETATEETVTDNNAKGLGCKPASKGKAKDSEHAKPPTFWKMVDQTLAGWRRDAAVNGDKVIGFHLQTAYVKDLKFCGIKAEQAKIPSYISKVPSDQQIRAQSLIAQVYINDLEGSDDDADDSVDG